MATIFDYLKDLAYDSIYDRTFGPLDCLALTELTYLSFQRLVPQGQSEIPVRLLDLPDRIDRTNTLMHTADRFRLLDTLAQTKRFKTIQLLHYVDEYDPDIQKQFAAMTYRIGLHHYLVVFRGTDDTLIGWKEDFHMTYMDHIPAQQRAASYLKEVMNEYPKARFIVSGHSKGGNLASYACSFLPASLLERVDQVYCYDSPGLNTTVIETPGYQAASTKIQQFIPQGSIVGMMLQIPENTRIVRSTALGGFAQHNIFTWQIQEDQFVTMNQTSEDSQQTDQTLKQWVAQTSDQELKLFFDSFFGLFLDAGFTTIGDFTKIENLPKFLQVYQHMKELDPQKQENLERLSRQLIDTRWQNWKQKTSKNSEPSKAQDLLLQAPDSSK